MKPVPVRTPFFFAKLLVMLVGLFAFACSPAVTRENTHTPGMPGGLLAADPTQHNVLPDGAWLTLPADAVTAISPTQGAQTWPDVTQESSPPEILPTITPSAVVPTAEPTRTPTSPRWVTRTPTITPTPVPPYAQLMIQKPGPASKIVSPVYCEFGVYTSGSGILFIDLLNEQGQSFVHEELYLYQGLSKRIYSSIELDFDLESAAIASRLVFSTRDYSDRLVALSSVDVVLLQLGSDEIEINPAISLYEPYVILKPIANNYVEGGSFVLSGMLRLVNSAPVTIDLVDEQNRVIDSTSLDISSGFRVNEYSQFSITIDYSVPSATRVRLLIWQGSDNRIPGVIAASSIPLILYP